MDRAVLTGRENSENGIGSQWLLELEDPRDRACPAFCAGRNMHKGHGGMGQQGQQNCSMSCSCDTDSGYEPSPAYFAVERRFEYPPVEDLEEEEFDDVFYDPPSFISLPSTP